MRRFCASTKLNKIDCMKEKWNFKNIWLPTVFLGRRFTMLSTKVKWKAQKKNFMERMSFWLSLFIVAFSLRFYTCLPFDRCVCDPISCIQGNALIVTATCSCCCFILNIFFSSIKSTHSRNIRYNFFFLLGYNNKALQWCSARRVKIPLPLQVYRIGVSCLHSLVSVWFFLLLFSFGDFHLFC